MVELLSPVGNFDSLKSAVQSGANAVYFGAGNFNARTYADNFNDSNLKSAIQYAKLRNVKVHFTLNTLIKETELEQAIELVSKVYSYGVDAIIVQDLGLAKYIIENFPGLDVHASTQMTIHNLDGVLELQKLGFKRIVLSRELSMHEIEYICQNSEVEIETFIHGAVCISYSGQCLFSSAVGGRSGNRGKCAQPCRLPYELISENTNTKKIKKLDKGYLLSPRDLCGLKFIPDLIKAGVSSFKIEGRMKSPEYVAIVTKIYRKYIDLACSDLPYIIDKADIRELMLAFNRGGFSDGNYRNDANKMYVYKEKPNNMGLYIGNISNYDSKKGLISFTPNDEFSIGDKFIIDGKDYVFTASELIKKDNNISYTAGGELITVGRVKGNIKVGSKVSKVSSKKTLDTISNAINKENVKIPLFAEIMVQKGKPICLNVKTLVKKYSIYNDILVQKKSDIIPVDAINSPITKERIIAQLSKTTDTQFEFSKFNIKMDSNVYVPQISAINQLRRTCLEMIEAQAISKFEREAPPSFPTAQINTKTHVNIKNPNISLLLNTIYSEDDYSLLDNVDSIYIPFKYFADSKYHEAINEISKKGSIYVYMPNIIKENFSNLILNHFENILEKFNIFGIVISNISSVHYLEKYIKKMDIIANYTFNIFNNFTIMELKNLGITKITVSPELDKQSICNMVNSSCLPTEILVYGKLPLMTTGYCLLGESNKCYPTCASHCEENSRFFLSDRFNLKFRVVPDKFQTVSTIYNSKITSIDYSDIHADSIRVSIIDKNVMKINSILKKVKQNKAFHGDEYTKGNLNRFV